MRSPPNDEIEEEVSVEEKVESSGGTAPKCAWTDDARKPGVLDTSTAAATTTLDTGSRARKLRARALVAWTAVDYSKTSRRTGL